MHTTQHLTHDHFDVLVVDLHTLQTIHVLHLVHNVGRQGFGTEQAQDVLRIRRPLDDDFAFIDHLAFVYGQVFLFANQEFVLTAVQISDDQTLFTTSFLTKRHRTGDFSQHTGVFR